MEKGLVDVSKLFGKNLKRIRKEKKMTQDQLSEKLGITQKHLSILETGSQFTTAQMISKIAKELDIQVSELFVEEPSSSQFDLLYEKLCNHFDNKILEACQK